MSNAPTPSLAGVQTIIWDLDGTLIDSLGLFHEILTEVLPRQGRAVPPLEMLIENFHGSLEESIANTLGGEIDPVALKAIVEDFLLTQNTHYEVLEHHFYKDALGLVYRAHAAGITQLIVTNRAHEGRLNASPRYIVENSTLNGRITDVICGDDSEHHKPQAKTIERWLTSGLVDPSHTVVIGDQYADAALAFNLGAEAILVQRLDAGIPNWDKLGDNTAHITVVPSLDLVQVS
jgi:phosphoglycolate phosphatase-like HAD superfamily hydrolase